MVAKGLRAQPEMTSPEVSLNRKSRDLGWETADQSKKSIVGSGWGKTAEEGGRKVQSPTRAAGVILESKKRRVDVGKNIFNGRHV